MKLIGRVLSDYFLLRIIIKISGLNHQTVLVRSLLTTILYGILIPFAIINFSSISSYYYTNDCSKPKDQITEESEITSLVNEKKSISTINISKSFENISKDVPNELSPMKIYASLLFLFWLCFREYRKEWIEKYMRLATIHDEILPRVKNKAKISRLLNKEYLNFAEDCLIYRMNRDISFRYTFNSIIKEVRNNKSHISWDAYPLIYRYLEKNTCG